MSTTVTSSMGAPQGMVLSPLLFALYHSRLLYNSQLRHMQSVRGEGELEYRSRVKDFVGWCHKNQLQLNAAKTK